MLFVESINPRIYTVYTIKRFLFLALVYLFYLYERVKYFICTLIIFISQNISAGVYQDRYTKCIIDNTSERDKVILVKWIFGLLADHPSLQSNFALDEDEKVSNDKAAADYISFVLGVKCLNETKDVLTYEGDEAFLSAFEMLGEIAFMELAENEEVALGFTRYIEYLDPSFWNKFEGF